MKNQKGITLIALVITIIVLLILAGVTIYMLTGPNGVITNSQRAKLDTMEKGAIEKINIALDSIKTEILAELAEDPTYNPTDNGNATKLENENVTGIKSGDNTGYTVTLNTTEKPETITITFQTEDYKKLKKSVDSETGDNAKIEGSIDLGTNEVTPATATNGNS